MESHVAKNFAVVSADQSGFVGTIVLEDHHMNVNNSVHGGMLGYLIDIAGGFAVISQTGSSQTGVSTDISYTMLAPAFKGETLTVKSFCDKIGKNMVYTTTSINVNERLIARGSHTRFLGFKKKESKL